MNGQNRKDITPGTSVKIVLKADQRTGKLTSGIVKDIFDQFKCSSPWNKSQTYRWTSRPSSGNTR